MDLKTIAPDTNNDITLSEPVLGQTWHTNVTYNILYSYSSISIERGADGIWIATIHDVKTTAYDNAWDAQVQSEPPSDDPDSSNLYFEYFFEDALKMKIEANRDIIVPSSFVFNKGISAYADILKAAILTQRTELQLYPSRGIPYFETAFDSPLKVRMWADAVRRTTNSFPWVARILDFEYNFSDEIQDNDGIIHKNGLTYTLRVLTDLGVATVRSDET